MKYKVGDKVILLKNICRVGLPSSSIGKECTVRVNNDFYNLVVREPGRRGSWYIHQDMVKPLIPIGEQLLFSFMEY